MCAAGCDACAAQITIPQWCNTNIALHRSSSLLGCLHFCDTDGKCLLRKRPQSCGGMVKSSEEHVCCPAVPSLGQDVGQPLALLFLLIRNNQPTATRIDLRTCGQAALTGTDIPKRLGGLPGQTGWQSWTIGPPSFGFQFLHF